MAKKAAKSEGESPFTYFRRLFTENQEWLKETSNAEAFKRYRADYGLADEAPIPKQAKDALANTKNLLRKKFGIESPRGRKARLKGRRGEVLVGATGGRGNKMANLEEQIDECMAFAMNLGRDQLNDVIRLLRDARNKVVVMRSGVETR